MKMEKIYGIAVAAALLGAALAGCKSVEVDRRAQSLATVRGAGGAAEVVRDAAGNPIVLDGGWNVD